MIGLAQRPRSMLHFTEASASAVTKVYRKLLRSRFSTEWPLFSARNNWDPLFGLDVGAAYKEWLYLSQNATVVESMLIALNHMQVSVCYLWSRGNLSKGHRGIPGFKKNIISFPQDIADLKNLQHFFSSLG